MKINNKEYKLPFAMNQGLISDGDGLLLCEVYYDHHGEAILEALNFYAQFKQDALKSHRDFEIKYLGGDTRK
jgi:hypothetical protein